MRKNFPTRIIQKHDSAENWNNLINFIPLSGELIIYSDLNKIKIGNGETNIVDLPFINGILIPDYSASDENKVLSIINGTLTWTEMIVELSQQEYDNLEEKKSNVLYCIREV